MCDGAIVIAVAHSTSDLMGVGDRKVARAYFPQASKVRMMLYPGAWVALVPVIELFLGYSLLRLVTTSFSVGNSINGRAKFLREHDDIATKS